MAQAYPRQAITLNQQVATRLLCPQIDAAVHTLLTDILTPA